VGHVPHLYLPQPWTDNQLTLPDRVDHHLRSVLRMTDGESLTYTDGQGVRGHGVLRAAIVERGVERLEAPPGVALTMAVAPPRDRDRTRFLVEKLAELGVRRLCWLRTEFGLDRRPSLDKAEAWARAALEQSRGTWLMTIARDWATPGELPTPVWFADLNRDPLPATPPALTVAVGPEGGWADGEVPPAGVRVGLGRNVLRVETAAIVAAGILLARQRLG
jgi:16S rRNA (uracil1498-N3)-methyltransferase